MPQMDESEQQLLTSLLIISKTSAPNTRPRGVCIKLQIKNVSLKCVCARTRVCARGVNQNTKPVFVFQAVVKGQVRDEKLPTSNCFLNYLVCQEIRHHTSNGNHFAITRVIAGGPKPSLGSVPQE